MHQPTTPERQFLAALFAEADRAGFGVADGCTFEAYPGQEDAAADFIEEWTVRLLGPLGSEA